MDPICKTSDLLLIADARDYLSRFGNDAEIESTCLAAHSVNAKELCVTPEAVQTIKEHAQAGSLTKTDLEQLARFASHHALLSAAKLEACTQASKSKPQSCDPAPVEAPFDADESMKVMIQVTPPECPSGKSQSPNALNQRDGQPKKV